MYFGLWAKYNHHWYVACSSIKRYNLSVPRDIMSNLRSLKATNYGTQYKPALYYKLLILRLLKNEPRWYSKLNPCPPLSTVSSMWICVPIYRHIDHQLSSLCLLSSLVSAHAPIIII